MRAKSNQFLIYGLIFTTGGYSFSLVWNKKSVYLFDSHSRDINGSFTNDGTTVVLSFKSLDDVELYIRTEYSKQIVNYNKSQFEPQYVRVATSPANVTAILDSLTAGKTYYQKQIGTPKHEQYKSKLRAQRTENIGTPEHEKIKKQKCEKRAEILGTLEHEEIKKQKCEKRAKIFGTPEHVEIKKKKRRLYHDQKHPKISSERISNFLKLVQEGPYYICVICNRCHYYRSVVFFKIETYDIDADNFYVEVPKL